MEKCSCSRGSYDQYTKINELINVRQKYQFPVSSSAFSSFFFFFLLLTVFLFGKFIYMHKQKKNFILSYDLSSEILVLAKNKKKKKKVFASVMALLVK